jgi:hypothetical protein
VHNLEICGFVVFSYKFRTYPVQKIFEFLCKVLPCKILEFVLHLVLEFKTLVLGLRTCGLGLNACGLGLAVFGLVNNSASK